MPLVHMQDIKDGRLNDDTPILPWFYRIRLACEVLSCMVDLHEQKFMHRDIKPSHILFDSNRHCLLAGFAGMRYVSSSSGDATGTGGDTGYTSRRICSTDTYADPDYWQYKMVINPLVKPAQDIVETIAPLLVIFCCVARKVV